MTELLGLYYLDTLGPAEGDLIEAHLPACAPCREEADRVIDTVAALALLSEKDREEVLDTFGALNRSGPPSERFVRFFGPEEPDPPPAETPPEPLGETRGPRRLPFGRRRAALRNPEPVNAPAVAPAPVAPPPVAPPPVAPRAVAPAATAPPAAPEPPHPKPAPQAKPVPQVKPVLQVKPVSQVKAESAPLAAVPVVKSAPPQVKAAPEVKAELPPVEAAPEVESEPLELPSGPLPSRAELVREPGRRRFTRHKPAEEKPASGPLPLAPPPATPPPAMTPSARPPVRQDPVGPPRVGSRRRSALVRSSALLALVLAIGGLTLGALLHGSGQSRTAAVPVITAAATAADRATGATLSVFVTQRESGVSVRATVDGLQAGAGYRLQAVTSDGHAWPVVNWTSDGKLQDITAEVRAPLSTLVFFTVSRAGSGPVVSAHLAPAPIRQE